MIRRIVSYSWVGLTMTTMIALSGFVAGAASAAHPESSVSCDEGVISEPIGMGYGEFTSNCVINSVVDIDRFSFEATAGDVVRIIVNSGGSNMDPRLEVRDPFGVKIEDVYCGNSCTFAREPSGFSLIPAATLLETGTYSLYISDKNSDETGAYSVQIEQVLPASTPPAIAFDSEVSDTIDQVTDVDFFTFDPGVGSEIRIVVNSGGNNMDPRMEVWDPAGEKLHDGYCGNSCTFAIETSDFSINPSPVTVAGTYTIALSDSNYDETGPYRISVHCLQGPCDPVEPLELGYDSALADAIDQVSDMDFYSFEATEGSEVRIVVNSGGTNMDPRMEVWDPDGEKLHDGYCGNSCTFAIETSDYSLLDSPAVPKTGTYRVALSDSNYDETGWYQINVHCLVGPCDPKAPKSLSYVTPRSDVVDDVTDMDFLTFWGIAGTEIRISVNSGGNNMDPRLEVWDPNGVKLHNQYCGNSCTFSVESDDFTLIPSLTLEETGTFRIALSDSNYDETGAYQVSIHCLHGACDSDNDGIYDGLPPELLYGIPVDGSVAAVTETDFFMFWGVDASEIRIVVNSGGNNMDPRMEVWDPDNVKLHDGYCGNSCTFALETQDFNIVASPTLEKTGRYRVVISDSNIDETGAYQVSVNCLFGSCTDEDPIPPNDGDNCIEVDNIDQRDTNFDGYGNVCDADFDNDGAVNGGDFVHFRGAYMTSCGHAGYDADIDFDESCDVGGGDFLWFRGQYNGVPGPSGRF